MTTLSVVLPVYNEAATVGTIIRQVLDLELPGIDLELIIVESNSTDGSRAIVARYADHPRVKVIYEGKPSGKGHAVRRGFGEVCGDIVLIQDADLEYRVEEYPVVLAPLLGGQADFVLGSRHAPGRPMRHFEQARHTSLIMNAAHWIFTGMFNLVYGTHLRDPFTMYKVFRSRCILGVPFLSDRFDFDWELVAKLVRLGFKPIEVPITYESRGYAGGKKVRFFRDPLTWVVALVRFRFSALTADASDPAIALRELRSPLHLTSLGEAGEAALEEDPPAGNGIPRDVTDLQAPYAG